MEWLSVMNNIRKDLEKNIIKNTLICLVINYFPFLSVQMGIILLLCYFAISLTDMVINKKENCWIPFLMLLYDAAVLCVLNIPADASRDFLKYIIERY